MMCTWSTVTEGLLKVLFPRIHCELQSPKDSKFWLVLHQRPCEKIGRSPRTNGGATMCNEYMNLLFCSGDHASLTLADVTKKSVRSACAIVGALGMFSYCPKIYISSFFIISSVKW